MMVIAKCVLYAPEIAPRLGIFRYVFDSDKTHFALVLKKLDRKTEA